MYTASYLALCPCLQVHFTDLKVEGSIPTELDGLYIRTGPNPMLPPVSGYHIFDGDGEQLQLMSVLLAMVATEHRGTHACAQTQHQV